MTINVTFPKDSEELKKRKLLQMSNSLKTINAEQSWNNLSTKDAEKHLEEINKEL
jgi:hypothetical protein